jgi:hypothetical protein
MRTSMSAASSGQEVRNDEPLSAQAPFRRTSGTCVRLAGVDEAAEAGSRDVTEPRGKNGLRSPASTEPLQTTRLSERARTGANIARTCHAEGRGFESLRPLVYPAKRHLRMSLQTTDDLLHAEGDELSPFGGLEPSTPLTMEAPASGYVNSEQVLVARFPCNSGDFAASGTLPQRTLTRPEDPRTCPQNLSPKTTSAGGSAGRAQRVFRLVSFRIECGRGYRSPRIASTKRGTPAVVRAQRRQAAGGKRSRSRVTIS